MHRILIFFIFFTASCSETVRVDVKPEPTVKVHTVKDINGKIVYIPVEEERPHVVIVRRAYISQPRRYIPAVNDHYNRRQIAEYRYARYHRHHYYHRRHHVNVPLSEITRLRVRIGK